MLAVVSCTQPSRPLRYPDPASRSIALILLPGLRRTPGLPVGPRGHVNLDTSESAVQRLDAGIASDRSRLAGCGTSEILHRFVNSILGRSLRLATCSGVQHQPTALAQAVTLDLIWRTAAGPQQEPIVRVYQRGRRVQSRRRQPVLLCHRRGHQHSEDGVKSLLITESSKPSATQVSLLARLSQRFA